MKFENISNHKYTTIKNAPTHTIYYTVILLDQEIEHYLLQNKSVLQNILFWAEMFTSRQSTHQCIQ